MNQIDQSLKEEYQFIKELFNFDDHETQLQDLKTIFTNFMKSSSSKYSRNYFILLLDFYCRCRVNQHHVAKALLECIYSFFPDQINEIQQYIKSFSLDDTLILKFIIFPKEFPITENKKTK